MNKLPTDILINILIYLKNDHNILNIMDDYPNFSRIKEVVYSKQLTEYGIYTSHDLNLPFNKNITDLSVIFNQPLEKREDIPRFSYTFNYW